ncbi:unnamed protein product [Caenorhabditis nigoni]
MNFETGISMCCIDGLQIIEVMKQYIPEKLMQCVKIPSSRAATVPDVIVIRFMLSRSDNMLRMYGTEGELTLNLRIFQNFPLSHRRFGFDPTEPYTTIRIVYKNMDGVPFMNKADAFHFLQCVFDRNCFETRKSFELVCSMQLIILKFHEEKIEGVCEFFKYDEAWWGQMKSSFVTLQGLFAEMSSAMFQDWNYEKALGMFKALLPTWKEQEYSRFERELRAFFDSNSGSFNDVHVAIRSFADLLKGIISGSRGIFLPYDKEKNPTCPIVVRVFYSDGVQFVMKSELFNAINIRNPDSKRLEFEDINGKLMTMSYEKAQRKYKERIGNIEFIKCPIQRAAHKAVPIMTPSGDHCTLAADFLFEMLNELIFTHRIFQKIGTENWNVLQRFFLQMTNFFSPHHKSIFFVTLGEQDNQKQELFKFWADFGNVPAKYVRNAKKDGFTVQNLKNELANLGLTELFPEIQDYAESVYSEVFKAKKEEFLRTCDLFKAVEKCLLDCIFKKFPNLRLFMHSQHACHRLSPINCEFCNLPNQATKVLEKAPEVEIPSPDDVQTTIPTKNFPTVDINQSKNCAKCLRTSEMCNEAKKELKSTQSKLEKYEKKAKRTEEVEKELKALKVEVTRKEKEVESRESDLQNKQKIIEQQESKLLKMEANETRMRLNEKNHSISQNELLKKVTELSDKLKIANERNGIMQSHFEQQKERMELQIQQNEESLKLEIRQKERGFEELRAALTIMSNENESIQRDNRNLREQIASISEAPPAPTVPESPLEGSTHHRFALLGFQKIKDSLYNKKQLKQAKEMIEKLKSSTNLVEIHQIADYEYYQFEGNMLKYVKEVELNIQRIKETCDVSMVTPLPDSPEFSNRFMNLYWKIINQQSITPSEIEVSDSECFICTEEMTSDQMTLQCEECKKVTHFECASQWLKIHRSCPHCRREMLDPEEFPNLGQ